MGGVDGRVEEVVERRAEHTAVSGLYSRGAGSESWGDSPGAGGPGYSAQR